LLSQQEGIFLACLPFDPWWNTIGKLGPGDKSIVADAKFFASTQGAHKLSNKHFEALLGLMKLCFRALPRAFCLCG
jgi:hypothetical protein